MIIEDYIFIFTLIFAFLLVGYAWGRKNLTELKLQLITYQKVSDLNIIECSTLMELLDNEIQQGNDRKTIETYIQIYNKLNKRDVKE